jgi:alginate O-acetyltransferase complex protein AlgI
LPILVGSIVLNYVCGVLIIAGYYRRLFLTVAVAVDIAALGYFKYTNFIVDQLTTHFSWHLGIEKVALPLAISFLTYQQITYVVHCYRKRVHDHSFLHYIFVVTFFPHLIAGPIARFREVASQLAPGLTKPALINLSIGAVIFIIGLAKKVLIADPLGEIAQPWFEVAGVSTTIDPMVAWVAALSLHVAALFRLFRLFRHGDRSLAHVRISAGGELPFAVPSQRVSRSFGGYLMWRPPHPRSRFF